MNQTLVINEQQLLLSEIANSEADTIERRLSASLSTTYILALELQQNNGELIDFDTYAQAVIDAIGGVSNLQLAPNGIIKNIYPLQGNEKALGHNILRDDLRRAEAQNAIKQRQLTLAGPFELVQGGIAIIGRNPVFIQVQGKDTFWGFTSVLIFLDKLLEVTKLSQLENKGYRYQLSRINPESKKVEVFARSKLDLTPFSLSTKIEVPNASWTLTLSRPMPTSWSNSVSYSISIILGVLIAWLVSYMLLQPELLQRTVRKKTAELERLAFYDPLTGLANRRLLSKNLQQLLSTVNDNNKASLLYLDLDDFKRINDSMGHTSGDKLLVEIAIRLDKIVKQSDLVVRLGGDEFAIILYNTHSINEVSKVAERLIKAVKKPVFLHKRRFVISTSIGITLIPKDGKDVQSLLCHADMAMYVAKSEGKNGFSFFDQQFHQQTMEKHRIESELSNAIKRQELLLHYQPLIDLTTRNVRSFEALIRWQHPTEGLIAPDRFIDIAEESGLIVEIGYWVIREACQMIKKSTVEYQQLTIAVNLSSKQFLDPNLLYNIQCILKDVDIDPRCLEIEITESSLMTNVTDVVYILEQLRIIGIKVVIDDFGTGYSSLAQLKQLPVDKLKIDRSFISSLALNQSDQEIVRAIIVMAHSLQIEVVAEGIETQQQLDILKNQKCNIGQGYLFSRPVPFDQALRHR
jgi:diguanylate cyclase (GGDEF)-like protein